MGVKAAVRVLGIVTVGSDVEPIGDMRNRAPSEIETRNTAEIPGVEGPVRDIFGVSQVLSWIAANGPK
jgi:hypothetical protein